MTFRTENLPGVSPTTPEQTRGFVFNHSMLRIKDPAVSLAFYTGVMGMKVLRKLDFPEMQFSLYFLHRDDGFAAIGGGGGLVGDHMPHPALAVAWVVHRHADLVLGQGDLRPGPFDIGTGRIGRMHADYIARHCAA